MELVEARGGMEVLGLAYQATVFQGCRTILKVGLGDNHSISRSLRWTFPPFRALQLMLRGLFPDGRLTVTHLRHRLSDARFRALLMLKLWDAYGLLADVNELVILLENSDGEQKEARQQRKRTAGVAEIVID
ncbi:hypothetical protein BT69DRAFT_204925 [Atractiella rhizophila]|nr:hypothetical protein BT69DRAFT_204925 [Atractiella rhizophila]